ncbi:Acyl-CoA desaturase [Penicillium herquei]|nr:Acyl-CoA desaturase [Penicillium herquei]
MISIYAVIQLCCSMVAFCDIGLGLLGNEYWQYPPIFGPGINARKLSFKGIWGEWWHDLFRFTFLGIADWVIRSSKVGERWENILVLGIPFLFYAAIHASLSYSISHDARASAWLVIFAGAQPLVILAQVRLRLVKHQAKSLMHTMVGLVAWLSTFGLVLGNPGVLHSLASFPIPISIWRKEPEGYHRLWAHKSFRAHIALRYFLAVVGAGMIQRSIKWWVRSHRAHHRYTDTELDPYNARKGFWYSHIGWLLFRQDDIMSQWDVDISDLENDPVVEWQDRYYIPLSNFMAFIVPGFIAHVGWRDLSGGLFWAGIIRLNVSLHFTFLVNSLAHWAGSRPFSTRTTARDNPLVVLITLGECYHNFHHEFPTDYRNGVAWFDIDISKWAIWLLAQVGLATNLNRVPEKIIEASRQRECKEQRTKVKFDLDSRGQVIEWEEYVQQAGRGRALIAIAGFVYDVTDFVDHHPGGKILNTAIGKDATAMFHGGIFQHSVAAGEMLSTMQVYVIRGGGPIEIRRKE